MLDIQDKLDKLKKRFSGMKSVLVAFSGGVDSSFLLKIARDVLGNRVLAATADSEIHASHELEHAKKTAKRLGVTHIILQSDEMADETFLANPPERCYHCKKRVFSRLKSLATEKNIENVVDGSNADDLGDFRPGIRALKELGVQSPLQEAGLTKTEIRQLSREMGLPTWDRPALACLASRIPYGVRITRETLKRIDEAESFLRDLGLKQIRVRHHGNLARIETSPDEKSMLEQDGLAAKVVKKLKSLGYTYVTLDLEGYRTGSLNEVLHPHE